MRIHRWDTRRTRFTFTRNRNFRNEYEKSFLLSNGCGLVKSGYDEFCSVAAYRRLEMHNMWLLLQTLQRRPRVSRMAPSR